MKIELKDVLHLYLGCKAEIERVVYPKAKINDKITPSTFTMLEMGTIKVKPILRPLSDMTQEERNHIDEIVKEYDKIIRETGTMSEGEKWAIMTSHTLKRGFDLFGLIKSSQAIDKTTIK